jgi:hypothetical protein
MTPDNNLGAVYIRRQQVQPRVFIPFGPNTASQSLKLIFQQAAINLIIDYELCLVVSKALAITEPSIRSAGTGVLADEQLQPTRPP